MSTHRQKVLKRLHLPENESYSLSDLSYYTKVPQSILQEVYNELS